MKWSPAFLAGLFFALLPNPLFAQDVEIRVISDDVMWPVDASEPARREDWWLINPPGDGTGAIRVTVVFGRPYCDNPDPESCDPYAMSQKIEVRAAENRSTNPAPPYYLVKGNLPWRRARQANGLREFDPESERSDIRVSLGANDYVVSRTLSGDKSRVTVSLRSGAVVQEIYACRTGGPSYPVCGDEGFEEILWAGDLDGDGRLDILAQFTKKYSMRRYLLYTSGNARQGALVGLSAEYGRYTD